MVYDTWAPIDADPGMTNVEVELRGGSWDCLTHRSTPIADPEEEHEYRSISH